MIARFILPWYGGSAAVWSACLLFFQAGLLIGYGYSHALAIRFKVSVQIKIHLLLLVISLISLPIIPQEWMKPASSDNPVTGILKLLLLTVGFPYIMIASTAPLMQHWFSLSNPKKSPYRLYALSNFASLIGLLIYPFIIEPELDLKSQAWFWTIGYFLFIVFCIVVSWDMWKLKPLVKSETKKQIKPVTTTLKILWMLFAFFGTTILLSFTNKLTQDILVVPFLWIIPLSLYLVTFIIAFEKPVWYNRKLFIPLALVAIFIVLRTQINSMELGYSHAAYSLIVQYSFLVFTLCMVLHGELARSKPTETHLTLFYFMTSLGGILAGIFITLIVPHVFNAYWETYLALSGSIMVLAFRFLRSDKSEKFNYPTVITFSLLSLAGVFYANANEYSEFKKNILSSTRNFYGVLKVYEESKGTTKWQRSFYHGNIIHGIQLMDSVASRIPFTYYSSLSGIGLTLTNFQAPTDTGSNGIRIGVIGLGIGTLSTYVKENYSIKFYEIDPEVENYARKYFKYLNNCLGKSEVVIGDGRISLENELIQSGSNRFDVLAVDAFSGDVIPAHLLTHEAVTLYLNHLNKNGVLAFHITNSYIDLIPVMCGISEKFKIPMHYIIKQVDAEDPASSLWVIFSINKEFLSNPALTPYLQYYDLKGNPIVHWTDDHTSVFSLIKEE
jgi:hypothetical protein